MFQPSDSIAHQSDHFGTVNRAFSKQSLHYDAEDDANIILKGMREQVYAHVDKFINPASNILELNAGTGIDAFRFAAHGHCVHATDLSTGMIREIARKVSAKGLDDRVSYQQLSYDQLNEVTHSKFDYVFSNFGGLNCIQDLSLVTRYLPILLNKNALVTFVIMPPVCLWEFLWVFKGKFTRAFRRLKKGGVLAHLEGEYFKTYYHNLSAIKAAFTPEFEFIETEGLCCVSPSPGAVNFVKRYDKIYQTLRRIDGTLSHMFPFNRCADHIIVTFRYNGINGLEG